MTEEVKQVVEEKSEEKAPDTPQFTDIELKAIDMGWHPQEEWDGDPEEFVDAKEYVGRKPLYDKIQSTGRALKETNKAIEALKTHYTKVKENEYKRALKTLQDQRQAAVAEGDGDTFQRLDTEIKGIEAEAAQVAQLSQTNLVKEVPQEPQAFVSWKERNSWYHKVDYMKTFADQLGVRLAGQGVQPEDVLKQVEQAVRKEFPHKFVNPKKADAPDVGASRGNAKSSKSAEDSLTPQERQIMNTLVRGGHITKEKYLADLKDVREQKQQRELI